MGARCQFNFATYEWISSCACQLNWLLHQLMWPHHRIGLKKLPQNDSLYGKIHVLVAKLHLNLVLVSWCSADLTSPCHWPFQNLPKSLHPWCIYDLGPHFPLFCAFVTQNKKKSFICHFECLRRSIPWHSGHLQNREEPFYDILKAEIDRRSAFFSTATSFKTL